MARKTITCEGRLVHFTCEHNGLSIPHHTAPYHGMPCHTIPITITMPYHTTPRHTIYSSFTPLRGKLLEWQQKLSWGWLQFPFYSSLAFYPTVSFWSFHTLLWNSFLSIINSFPPTPILDYGMCRKMFPLQQDHRSPFLRIQKLVRIDNEITCSGKCGS